MWNSSNTDGKGSELENFIEKNNLNVIKKPKSKLTYIPKHTSMIDVTIAGDKPKVKSWEYLKEDSLSDHPYIYFEIELEKTYRAHSGDEDIASPTLYLLGESTLHLPDNDTTSPVITSPIVT